MIKSVVKFVTLGTFLMALIAAPSVIPAFAAGGGGGGGGGGPGDDLMRPSAAPPQDSKGSRITHRAKKKPSKQSSAFDDPAFAQAYRAAYSTIYDHNDYAAAIEQLKPLGHDDQATLPNLIAYSYPNLAAHKLSQIWYERA